MRLNSDCKLLFGKAAQQAESCYEAQQRPSNKQLRRKFSLSLKNSCHVQLPV